MPREHRRVSTEDLPVRALTPRSDQRVMPVIVTHAFMAVGLTAIWLLWIMALVWTAERF